MTAGVETSTAVLVEIIMYVAVEIMAVAQAAVGTMKAGTATIPPALMAIPLDTAMVDPVASIAVLQTEAGIPEGMTAKTMAGIPEAETMAAMITGGRILVGQVAARIAAPATMVDPGMGKRHVVGVKTVMEKFHLKSALGVQAR